MTTTDLKPGDIAQHPEYGYGLVLKNFPGVPTIYYAGEHGYERTTRRYTGWGRVEIVRPGHVQVRVDDLAGELLHWREVGDRALWVEKVIRERAAQAFAAQRAESTPPADEQGSAAPSTLDDWYKRVADGVELVRRASKITSDEQEADFASGWLRCPWCREDFAILPRLARDPGNRVRAVGLSVTHTCAPAQPDEPQEFGARITVDGERWLRVGDSDSSFPWRRCEGVLAAWGELTERGLVTLGWDD